MLFRHRYNCVYRDLRAHREPGVMVSYLLPEGGRSEPVGWLGSMDRVLAKQLPGTRQVALDVEGYRPCELDPTTWLGVGEYVVGFLIDGGLVGVTDGRKPLTKRTRDGQNGEPDRLGRVLKVSAARPG